MLVCAYIFVIVCMFILHMALLLMKKLLVTPKYDFLCTVKFFIFEYCPCNIELFSIAPNKVIALQNL